MTCCLYNSNEDNLIYILNEWSFCQRVFWRFFARFAEEGLEDFDQASDNQGGVEKKSD